VCSSVLQWNAKPLSNFALQCNTLRNYSIYAALQLKGCATKNLGTHLCCSICSVLQYVAVYRSVQQCSVQITVTHRDTLQHTAANCNTLQHIATHYNTLQHTTLQLEGCAAQILGILLISPVCIDKNIDRQTCRQTHICRQIDRQIDRQTDTHMQTDRQIDRQTDTHMQTDRQTDRHTYADRQTDRQPHICRQTDR